MSHSMSETVAIPKGVLATAQSLEDIEDWLATHRPDFITDLRRIRREEDLAGHGISLEEGAKQWGIGL